MESNKNLSIELLRFILSILVVVHHFYWYYNGKMFNDEVFVDYIFNFMQIGVDVFFIISGFFIARSLLSRSPSSFLIHRIIRIFPLYFLISSFILIVMIYNPIVFNTLPSNLTMAYIKSILFIPFHDGIYQGPLLSVGWSLNLEVLYYIVAFCTFIIFRKISVIYLFISFVFLNMVYFIIENQISYYFTRTIIVEFFMGVFIFQYFNKINRVFNEYKVSIFLVSILSFIAIFIFKVNIFDPNLRFIVGIFACIFFLIFYNKTLDFWILRLLGELSYPIYLIHLPLIYLIYKFTDNLLYLLFLISISLLICSYLVVLFQRKINEYFIK